MTYFLDNASMAVASAPGTGAIALGAAATGAQTFASAGVVSGQLIGYAIQDSGGAWEYGRGTYSSSGPTLTRTTVLASSNSGSAINATSAAIVTATVLAEDLNLGYVGTAGGYVNKFRNGGFDVDQRGTSGSVSSGATAYTLDGWQISATGAAAAWAQIWQAFINGNSIKIAAATGLTAVTLKQRIESYSAVELLTVFGAGQPITVQFEISNQTSSPITPTLSTGYASARDNFGTVTADLAATNLQTIAASSTGLVSYTFTPSNSAYLGYEISLNFGGALNGASGYVQVGRADVRVTPGQPTGLNSSPPPPELRPLSAELRDCQRFYDTSYDLGTAPGSSTVSSGGTGNMGTYGLNPSSVFYNTPQMALFHGAMRAVPSLSTWDRAGNSGKMTEWISSAYTDNISGFATGVISTKGFSWSPNVSTGYAYYVHWAASAEL